MKQFIHNLILGILIILAPSCENVDAELYQNPPTIQEVEIKLVGTRSSANSIEFDIYITLDKAYSSSLTGEVKRGTSARKVYFTQYSNNRYRCRYEVPIKEFDTSEDGYLKLSSFDISIIAYDGTDNVLTTFTVDEVRVKLPTITSVTYKVSTYGNYDVTFKTTVNLDCFVGDSFHISVKSKDKRTQIYRLSHVGDNIYSAYPYVDYSSFDSIDYDEGRVNFDKIEISGYTLPTTNTYVLSNKSYFVVKPSIQVTKVEKGETTYNSSDNRYYTDYWVYYTISGEPFLKEAYIYYIGNWTNPGKGYSLSIDEGKNSTGGTVNYVYSSSDYVYIQYRAMTKAGTELISDKAVCFEGTGKGGKYIYLVNSSSIYSTRNSCSDPSADVAIEPLVLDTKGANRQTMSIAIPTPHQENKK